MKFKKGDIVEIYNSVLSTFNGSICCVAAADVYSCHLTFIYCTNSYTREYLIKDETRVFSNRELKLIVLTKLERALYAD
jgi:hypothetical protein